MSREGIKRMAGVFETLQQAACGLIETGASSDVASKSAQQDILLGKLCQKMNDFAKEEFMEIIKFVPEKEGKT